ncbi:MAG: hypothetical protein FD152_1503 [Xanthobacteraceae bacterium]|nr:MAG: hypothetical protein FD152_1503 [Xanthobacteraceae bacterium]
MRSGRYRRGATQGARSAPISCPHPYSVRDRRCRTPGELGMKRSEDRRSRIRSWRSETLAVTETLGQRLRAGEALFGSRADRAAERRRLQSLLRAERARRSGDPAGYDLGRHAALIGAVARLGPPCVDEKTPPGGPDGASRKPLASISGPCGGAAGQDPSAWRAASGQPHSSARPSDSRPAGPTSRDSLPATDCTGCEGGASAT